MESSWQRLGCSGAVGLHRITAGILGLGRGREKMKLGLGSIARAVMHSTVNWSQQENQLEPGLRWLKAMGDSAPVNEPCGSPLPLGSLGAALGWRSLHGGEAMVLVTLWVPGRGELPQEQLCRAEPSGLLSY